MEFKSFVFLFCVVHLSSSQTPCSTFSHCDYQGCSQPANEGSYYGCNCQYMQVKDTETGEMENHCYLGNDEHPVELGTCVYSTDYAVSFKPCPCKTSCSPGELLKECSCHPCPAGHTCDGSATLCANTCPSGLYLDGCECKACPSGSLCVGSKITLCTVCDNESFEIAPCTSTTDRMCHPCNRCLDSEYPSRQCSSGLNRICAPCTYCARNFYAAAPCSNTSNTKCSPCLPGHWCPGNQQMYEPIAPGSNVYKDM